MLDSGTKLPENRIHLFDPVGLINDSYGGTYRSSSYATKPRRPTKSYGNFEEVHTNGGLISYDSFKTEVNGVGGLRSYDSFTDPGNIELRSYDSFSMKTNAEGTNGVEIRFDNNGLEDETEVSTPRLWKNSSPASPMSKNNNSYFHPNSHSSMSSMNSSPFSPTKSMPLNANKPVNSLPLSPTSPPNHNYHQNMSPSSRTQAIAKGRRELMDMVRDLPESLYELSLKDIVEQKAEFGVKNKSFTDIPEEKKGVNMKDINGVIKTLEKKKKVKKTGKKVKKSESKKKMVRSKNVDNGRFLLRTSVFPIFSGSRKNTKRLGVSSSLKIAPMPSPKPSSSRSMKVVERDWWRRKSGISNDRDDGLTNKSESGESSGSSSRSSSNNGRKSNRFLPNCCLFNGRGIRSKK